MYYMLCKSIEKYNELNADFTVALNYHLPTVQAETGTSQYAGEPIPIWYDDQDNIYSEDPTIVAPVEPEPPVIDPETGEEIQPEPVTVEPEKNYYIGYLFPVNDKVIKIVMMMKGERFYGSDYQFLFVS